MNGLPLDIVTAHHITLSIINHLIFNDLHSIAIQELVVLRYDVLKLISGFEAKISCLKLFYKLEE